MEKKVNSFLANMKSKVKNQEVFGGRTEDKASEMEITDCPNCGAGKAKQDGVTHCAYCGHEFMSVKISDGLNLKKEDNSKS